MSFVVGCQSIETPPVDDIAMKVGIIYGNFSVSVPEDYVETSSQYIDKYYTKDDSASIIVTKDSNSYSTIQQYYDNAMVQYTKLFDGVNTISSESVNYKNLYDGVLAEFSYQVVSEDSTIDMTCYTEYLAVGNTVYIVTCSAPTDTYATYRDEFISTVQSIMVS
jgi:hypothetical protein